MRLKFTLALGVAITAGALVLGPSSAAWARPAAQQRAKNVILFIGDGMGISTIAATRIFSVGVDGNLVMDQLPHAALSRTADADHVTPDSASTMTSMMTGVNANSGVIGFGRRERRHDRGSSDGAQRHGQHR